VLKVPLVLYVILSTVHMSVVCLVTDDTLQVNVALPPALKLNGDALNESFEETVANPEQSEE